MLDLSIIILTFNEEQNIRACLDSVKGITDKVLVVDSGSADNTLKILKEYPVRILSHPFENYSKQRNWSQQNNPFQTEWVFHIDAGERLSPKLREWMLTQFDVNSEYDGFMFSRQDFFMGKWIRYGKRYPIYHLRLYRTEKGKCEEKVYDQHFVLDGRKCVLKKGLDIIDNVAGDLRTFTINHNRWAITEAVEWLMVKGVSGDVNAQLAGNPIERRRWFKNNIFQKTPLFLRAFLYFNYRYFLCMGFLDGKVGLVYHFLQGFWFRFLVDATILEIQQEIKKKHCPLSEALHNLYGCDINKLINS
jgi:glycosyltransferase involved in cell wall biosynthesis